MAAYSVLISLRETLKDFIQNNPHHIFECRNGRHLFESLQRNVMYMQEELFDKFPRKVGKWEEKIHDSCNEAESIIEDHIALTIRRKGEVLRAWSYRICECKKQSSLHSQIYQIGAVIDSIVNEMKSEIVLGDSEEKRNIGDDSYSRNFSHLNQMPQKQRLFGFENHLKEIKSRLLYGASKQLEVVAIVGMGGIGKTSLARALFDDESIVDGFDIRRWVKVSQSCDVKAILLAILESENSSCDTNVEINVIGYRIYKLLYRKKYLLVFDDIWESEAWDKVRMHLPDWETKSRVLLTTRNKDVARYTKPERLDSIYDLELLDEETSWSMLKHKVFGEEDCPSELVEIGQKIAEGCNGLPLAIVVIGGILVHVDPNRDSWDKIANDVSEVVETGDEKFSEVLSLSYHHLPHYLRPYFLFMTCSKSLDIAHLVNSLISERFFKPNKNYECDVKENVMECLNELLDRNLIIVTERKYNGEVMSFGIHDLMRNLSIKLSKEEKFFHPDPFVGAAEIIRTTRRAHFHEKPHLNSVNELNLRTVTCCSKDALATLERCRHLRILHGYVFFPLNMLSERLQLCHLRNLRLTVSKNECLVVSSAISKLVNLEYLAIKCDWPYTDSVFIIDIWKLPKLCSFHVDPIVMLAHPVVKTSSPFLNLRQLYSIANFSFTEDTVKSIPNVKRISVHYSASSCAESCSYFGFENLCHLTHLERLKLVFHSGSYELMNYVTFPSSLKSLLLAGEASGVTWDDITKKIGSLPNLERLRLRGHAVCGGNVWEINEGYFKKLQVLEVSVSCLKCLKTDGSGNAFPKLERLILIACPFLTDLPDDIGEIPTLKFIIVDDHQEAIVNWAKQIEQDQSDNGNEPFRIIVLRIATVLKKCGLKKGTKLKKYEEKEIKKDEMFDHPVGEAPMDKRIEVAQVVKQGLDMLARFEQNRDNGNKLFRVLLAKIFVEIAKYQQFRWEKSNENRMEAFQVIALRIDTELNKYEEQEKEHKMFYHQEAIKLFRDVVLKVVEVLKKFEEEEGEEEKTRYHQEANKLFLVIVDRIKKEIDKYDKEEIKRYERYLKLRRYLGTSYVDDNDDQEKDKCDEKEEYEDEKFLKMHTYLRHIYFDDNGDQELKKYEEKKSNQDEIFEEKENKEYRETLDLWVKFEQDRPDNRNKFFRVLFAKVAAVRRDKKSKIDVYWRSTLKMVVDLKKSMELNNWETLSLQVKVGEDQPKNGNKPFEVSIPINVADLKKYMEQESTEDEVFYHDRPDNGNVLFLVLVAKIAAELRKYQSFELGESNKSKIEVFWEMARGIFAVLTKYEEKEKEHTTFYQQEAIELFRDIVLKIFEVLKKYEEEESEEQKMCYYQEAYKLLRVIALRIVLETGKFAENAEADDMYLRMFTYLRHHYLVDGGHGLYNHAVRSIPYIYPGLRNRLFRRECPMDLLDREESLACIDIPP